MVFVLYLNNNLLGIFDNENALNTFIKGGIQNKFFKEENLRREQYIMNSCCKVGFNINTNIQQKETIEKIPEETLQKSKESKKEKGKKLDELLNSESYKKIAQEKIDVVTDINKIKYDKKLMVEKNKLYNEDIKLFELFTKEKEKNNNFIIPALFELKFSIFDSLTKANNLSFETFIEEYEKVKPENNYDMFTSNNYEKTFEKNNKDFEMEFELQI
jgi:hypothetical protein